MSTKHKLLAYMLAVLFCPILLAGFLYRLLSHYFVCGQGICEVCMDWVVDSLED